jgi:hypothetical protein
MKKETNYQTDYEKESLTTGQAILFVIAAFLLGLFGDHIFNLIF